MPLRDGTGPPGGQPRSGRRLGWCFGRSRPAPGSTSDRSTGTRLLSRILWPLGTAVATDLLRPNSAIRRVLGKVTNRLAQGRNRPLLK